MSFSVRAVRKNVLPAAPGICLVLGVMVAVYFALCRGKEGNTSQVSISAVILEKLPVEVTLEPLRHVGKPRMYANVKDPFVSPEMEAIADAEELPQLRLTMIIIDKRHKMCRVNGKLYTEGEKGPDFLVKFIGEEKVLIERRGRGQWLFLARNS